MFVRVVRVGQYRYMQVVHSVWRQGKTYQSALGRQRGHRGSVRLSHPGRGDIAHPLPWVPGPLALFRLLPVPPARATGPAKRQPQTCSTGWNSTAPRCSPSCTTSRCPSTTTWRSATCAWSRCSRRSPVPSAASPVHRPSAASAATSRPCASGATRSWRRSRPASGASRSSNPAPLEPAIVSPPGANAGSLPTHGAREYLPACGCQTTSACRSPYPENEKICAPTLREGGIPGGGRRSALLDLAGTG